MVLSFNRPGWTIDFRREHLPRALSWALIATIMAFFGWAYLSNAKPGPYGTCYAGRGRPVPCGPVEAKAANEKALPIAKAP